MKILRAYKIEADRRAAYGTNSTLFEEIRKKYDLTEIVLEEGYNVAEYAETIRQYDVLLTMWKSPRVPDELADNPGNLRLICNITGSVSEWISEKIIESPYITVTNWGDAPAFGVAEGAFALMMSVMKDIPLSIEHAKNNGISAHPDRKLASLYKMRIGIYGLGVIGRKFVDMLSPFMPVIYAYDPYVSQADMPDGVTKVENLEELFSKSQIMVIHAGLSEETRGSVTKEHLAMLPDGGIIINTARGAIIDGEALRAELESGRLRAGLDVMFPQDWPDEDDPIRQWRNVIMTGHFIGNPIWGVDPDKLDFTELNCLETLNLFSEGKPLKFVIDTNRYNRMT